VTLVCRPISFVRRLPRSQSNAPFRAWWRVKDQNAVMFPQSEQNHHNIIWLETAMEKIPHGVT
jgi:hypothetical protein